MKKERKDYRKKEKKRFAIYKNFFSSSPNLLK